MAARIATVKTEQNICAMRPLDVVPRLVEERFLQASRNVSVTGVLLVKG